MKPYIFPFLALVGQEKLKTGLLLNAVDPVIGGILISGHKGTGKSTAVRALAKVLPEIAVVADCPYNCAPDDIENLCPGCLESLNRGETLQTIQRPMPLVELPLSATEDRVIGTLHMERILKTGERRFEPGLLASANRGILYVDEVNLLDDHLVDILLDAAASGVNLVERESISFSHPSRFMLIGTMNPEEGELRPQFLDRFGLSLAVTSLADPLLRHRLVKRRISFDRDPRAFCSAFSDDETLLSSQIRLARQGVAEITIPSLMIELAVTLASRVQAQGHRAEITIIKAARALAALLECSEIEEQHVIEAARYVLPHRMTTLSLASAEQIEQTLEDLFRQLRAEDGAAESTNTVSAEIDSWDDLPEGVPGATAASNVSMLFNFLAEKKVVYEPDKLICVADLDLDSIKINGGSAGRLKMVRTNSNSGRYVRAERLQDKERDYQIAADATIKAALLRQALEQSAEDFSVVPADLRKKIFERPTRNLIVFVVDSSDSMGDDTTHARIRAAKGVVLAALDKAYTKRHQVAMVVFRDESAQVALQPTSSLNLAEKCLKQLPTGGTTPFADGLIKAWQLIKTQRIKDRHVRPLLVILSDGEANVPYDAGRNPDEVKDELLQICRRIGADQIGSLVIDTRPLREPSPAMREISEALSGSYHHISSLKAQGVLQKIINF